jgi:gas vesicle protein
MIIHLANEEDKAGLLVGQYKQNGSKILDNLTRKRETERATILQKLNQKKKEMVSIYTEAKEFVMETAEDLKDSIDHFEKDWQKQQQAIQEKISEGRKLSE